MSEVLLWCILHARPDLTVDDVEKRVAEKIAVFGGLIKREVALKLVAAELGVQIPVQRKELRITLKDLVDGLQDVQLVVTVKGVGQVSEFQREGGTTGRFVKVSVCDESGEGTLLLWNEKTDLASGLVPQQKLRVSGAYTKKNKFGEVELNLGRRGRLEPLESTGG